MYLYQRSDNHLIDNTLLVENCDIADFQSIEDADLPPFDTVDLPPFEKDEPKSTDRQSIEVSDLQSLETAAVFQSQSIETADFSGPGGVDELGFGLFESGVEFQLSDDFGVDVSEEEILALLVSNATKTFLTRI
jgi:hypothetical protein